MIYLNCAVAVESQASGERLRTPLEVSHFLVPTLIHARFMSGMSVRHSATGR